MGIVKCSLVIGSLMFSSVAMAGQYKYIAVDDSKESKICVSAATDSIASFGKFVSDSAVDTFPGVHFRNIANNLYCNGDSVIRFAQAAGNNDVADRLSKYRKGNVSIQYMSQHKAVYQGAVLIAKQ